MTDVGGIAGAGAVVLVDAFLFFGGRAAFVFVAEYIFKLGSRFENGVDAGF